MKRIVWAMLLMPLAPVGWVHGDEVESRRFDNQRFYDGLIELGLLDLLDHHLAQNPPKDELTGWLLQRKIKQVIWENPAIDPPRRRAALAEANALLARLIREHPRDRRALDWQLDLARSLIYEQAEPAYTRILYHGGTAADRQTLTALMEAALETLDRLRAYLEKEYARIDELSLGSTSVSTATGTCSRSKSPCRGRNTCSGGPSFTWPWRSKNPRRAATGCCARCSPNSKTRRVC
jgi:hypothetical protein